MYNVKSFLFFGVVWLTVHLSRAEETNGLYLTKLYFDSAIVGPSREELLAEARTNRESLPAKDFPEGNWGDPTQGLQLSLRLEKQAYTNGEPINALLLARNITNQFVGFGYPIYAIGGAIPIGFAVKAANGQPLTSRQEGPIAPGTVRALGAQLIEIAPQTQFKFFERLNDMFDLTNGDYLVHATVNINQRKILDGKSVSVGWVEVKSADVQIKIVGSPADSKK